MKHYPEAAMERARQVQEVIWRAIGKGIPWWQALLSQGGLTPVGFRPQGVGGQAAVAGAGGTVRVRRAVGPAAGKAESPAGAAGEKKSRPRRAVAKTVAAPPGQSLRDCHFPTAILIRPTQTLEPHLSLAKKTGYFNLLTTGKD